MDYEKGFSSWKVLVSDDVLQDLDNFVYYLLVEKLNEQAANAVLEDYDETIDILATVAGRLKLLEDPEFAEKGYRKIRFQRHNYYLIYRIVEDSAVVYRMFHDLQDLDKALR